MSKVDQLRAMREARYEAMQRTQRTTIPKPSKPGKSVQGARPAMVIVDEIADFDPPAAQCGHMSISKKKCIRPKDHAEKNHRYEKS